jgi:RNA polymerase sigma-70 factor (ECF subfamily)
MDFLEVYERHVHDVHRFALYLSGNHALAEDLTAETFVNLFCARSDLRVGTVKAYLFAIARNLYRDFMAHQRRMVPGDELPEQADPVPGPDLSAQGRQTFSIVLRAIQGLPESQREALVLAVDQELSYEQIAAILGCSVVAVKVRIHRARLKLRSELEKKEQHAQTLAQGGQDPLAACAPPSLPPDHELKTLARLKRRLSVHPWLLTFAMIWSGMAFGRIVSDTSFDVSPRNFIVTAVIAACFWIAFFVSLFRGRRSILVRLR